MCAGVRLFVCVFVCICDCVQWCVCVFLCPDMCRQLLQPAAAAAAGNAITSLPKKCPSRFHTGPPSEPGSLDVLGRAQLAHFAHPRGRVRGGLKRPKNRPHVLARSPIGLMENNQKRLATSYGGAPVCVCFVNPCDW